MKKCIFYLIMYSVFALTFLCLINKQLSSIQTPFVDFYLFTTVFLIYYRLIDNNKFNSMEIIRFKNIRYYIIYKLKKFALFNIIVTAGISFINIIPYLIFNIRIDFLLVINYLINLFVIYEILYLYILSYNLLRSKKIITYITYLAYILMFFIGIEMLFQNQMQIGLFISYLNIIDIRYTILNYIGWILVPILIIYNFEGKKDL